MNLKQIKLVIRVLFSKLFIYYLFKKYVIDNEILKEDIIQNFKIRSSNKENTTLFKKFSHLLIYYPEFSFVFFWRIQSNFFLWKILFKYNKSCKIFTSSLIQGGLVAYHPLATVINAKKIGKNFIFRNGLTIGNKNNDNRLLPSIGNNVEVGANVVIIGDIKIGDNVIIGAGSVVVKSVPSNSVIAGNPARIIKKI
jgi:serine O-acetyltransferase